MSGKATAGGDDLVTLTHCLADTCELKTNCVTKHTDDTCMDCAANLDADFKINAKPYLKLADRTCDACGDDKTTLWIDGTFEPVAACVKESDLTATGDKFDFKDGT